MSKWKWGWHWCCVDSGPVRKVKAIGHKRHAHIWQAKFAARIHMIFHGCTWNNIHISAMGSPVKRRKI